MSNEGPTIEGECVGVELGKRFYMPGVTVKQPCPNCGAAWECDMGDRYLSYPVVGETVKLSAGCGECDHEWTIPVVVRVTLELAKTEAAT